MASILGSIDIAPDSGLRDLPDSPGAPMTVRSRLRRAFWSGDDLYGMVPCHGNGQERSRRAGQGHAGHRWDSVMVTESSTLTQARKPGAVVGAGRNDGRTDINPYCRCTGLRRIRLHLIGAHS